MDLRGSSREKTKYMKKKKEQNKNPRTPSNAKGTP